MVNCIKCGREHELDSETYLVIQGNIYIGKNGGVVGNNFPQGVDKDDNFTTGSNYIERDVPFHAENVRKTYFCIGCFGQQVDEWMQAAKAKIVKEIDDRQQLLDMFKYKTS